MVMLQGCVEVLKPHHANLMGSVLLGMKQHCRPRKQEREAVIYDTLCFQGGQCIAAERSCAHQVSMGRFAALGLIFDQCKSLVCRAMACAPVLFQRSSNTSLERAPKVPMQPTHDWIGACIDLFGTALHCD